MVRNTYGKTPWGHAFLYDGLCSFIDEGRLKRGKTYANTGKVFQVKFEGCRVIAKVRGSFSPFYNINISFTQFTAEEKKKIMEIIDKKPLLLAEIMNGKLPEALIASCKSQDIFILPRGFSDMPSSCDCPDFACPCKHLASVFYVLTAAVDTDPFILFSLRGFDMKKSFGVVARDTNIYYPISRSTEIPKRLLVTGACETKADEDLQLLKIPDCASFILGALLKNPPFSMQLDYHSVLNEFYSNVKKTHANIFTTGVAKGTKKKPTKEKTSSGLLGNTQDENGEIVNRMEKVERLLSQATFKLELSGAWANDPLVKIHNSLFSELAAQDLVAKLELPFKLQKLENEVIVLGSLWVVMHLMLKFSSAKGSYSYSALFNASRVTLLLVSSRAFIPAVIPLGNHSFRIAYQPLESVPIVAAQIALLASSMRHFNFSIRGLMQNNDTISPLQGWGGTIHLLSAMITIFVRKMKFMHKKLKKNPPAESLAFFRSHCFSVVSLSQRGVGKGISDWLSVFALMQADFKATLHLKESTQGNYLLALKLSLLSSPHAEELGVIEFAKMYPNSKLKALRYVARMSRYLSLDDLLDGKASPINISQFESFVLRVAPTLQRLGVCVVLPKSLKSIFKPKAAVHASFAENGDENTSTGIGNSSWLTIKKLLRYDWQIAVGPDVFVSVVEFQKAVAAGRELFKVRNRYVHLDAADIANLLKTVAKPPPKPSPRELLRMALQADGSLAASAQITTVLESLVRVTEHSIPPTLCATLRDYQVRGFRWLVSNLLSGCGCILADDMGLGKTIQTITALLFLRQEAEEENRTTSHPVLIVAPTSLLSNWKSEIARFAPSLSVLTYHGPNRNATQFGQRRSKNNGTSDSVCKKKRRLLPVHVILTTYGVARTDLSTLMNSKFSALVCDEAQAVKNAKSATSKALRALAKKVPHRIALSGTPVENRLSELWCIFDLVFPDYLGTLKKFGKNFVKPIEKEMDQNRAELLKRCTAPFMLRRMKTDPGIKKDLPDKIVIDQMCKMPVAQASLYQSVVDEFKASLGKGNEHKGAVLKVISALKQMCNHPNTYDSKHPGTLELSGKVMFLEQLLKQIVDSGEKVLVFSQFAKTIALLRGLIRRHLLIDPLVIQGSTSRKDRDKSVAEFQTNPGKKIFLLSLRAAGTGLNLTAATHVIHFDLWWNPAVENQATDRAYRIGQKKTVYVHRLITTGTFETYINNMMKRKAALGDAIVSKGESWLADLSSDQIQEMFSPPEAEE